jgi:hypothetical protein
MNQLSHSGAHAWEVSSYEGRLYFEQEFYFDETGLDTTPAVFSPLGYELFLYSWPAGDAVLGETGHSIPDWVAAGAAFVVGVLPWFVRPRQFSLRTLLVFVTVVAVVLGAAIYL